MSFLKKKSEINNSAAVILKKTHCCSSIHCSYYSCVQLAKYILIEKLNKKNDLENLQNFKVFHKYYIETIYTHLMNKDAKFKALDFSRNIKELKAFREEADYEDKQIDTAKSDEAIKKAEKIQNILTNFFEL